MNRLGIPIFVIVLQLLDYDGKCQTLCPVGLMSESASANLVSRMLTSQLHATPNLNVVSVLATQQLSDQSIEYLVVVSPNSELSLIESDKALTVRNTRQRVRQTHHENNFWVARVVASWANYTMSFKMTEIYPSSTHLKNALSFSFKTNATKITVDQDLSVLNTIIYFRNKGIVFAFEEEGTEIPSLSDIKNFSLNELPDFGCYLWLPVSWLNKKLRDKEFAAKYNDKNLKVNNPKFTLLNDEVNLTTDFYVEGNKFSRVETRFSQKDMVTNSVKVNPYLDTCGSVDIACLISNQAKIFSASTYETVLSRYIGRRLKLFEPGLKVKIVMDKYQINPKTDGKQSFVFNDNLIFFTSLN